MCSPFYKWRKTKSFQGERCRQVQGGTGERPTEIHRTGRLLQGATYSPSRWSACTMRPRMPPRECQAAEGTALRAAFESGSPQSGLVLGHRLPADQGSRRMAIPLSGGRRLELPTWPKASVTEVQGGGL